MVVSAYIINFWSTYNTTSFSLALIDGSQSTTFIILSYNAANDPSRRFFLLFKLLGANLLIYAVY